jgi:hypothetical protein
LIALAAIHVCAVLADPAKGSIPPFSKARPAWTQPFH